MQKTNLVVMAAALSLALAACGPIRTVTPAASKATLPPVGASMSAPAASNASQAAPAATSAGQPASVGPVALQILSPKDGDVLNAAQVQVTGTASPGAVVTVNDDIIVVGADGTFQSLVTLDEGPNLIEIVASNESGDQSSVELTVTYAP